MRFKINTKNFIIEAICLLYILLFVYAAVSKILEFENFQAQLGQSTILGAYAGIISYTVIIIELLTSLMLSIPHFRLKGLYVSFGLMCLFTIYIFIILNFTTNIPCSCGGILEKMTWKEHLVFNIIWVAMSVAALFLYSEMRRKTAFVMLGIFISAGFLVTVLNVTSQYLIHKENPFVRKFVHGSANKVLSVPLNNNRAYFAGNSKGIIYIADRLAPLHIMAYDTTLKIRKYFKIQLDHEDFPFRSVQVKILGEYFFIMDGTVPVVYRGKIADWKGEIIMKESGYYFSKSVIIDSANIAFRTQNEKSGENELGVFSFKKGLKSKLHTQLLQKQIDGFFDTDGMMNYSPQNKIFTYLYYYRNEFIVTDEKLNLKFRANTIDTTIRAKLKPVYIKEIGRRKLGSPDYVVNKISTLRNNHLFVNSKLRGKYEPKEMWNIASVVDVYDVAEKSYLSSFYIYNSGSLKMKDMLVAGNNVYIISGMDLQRYTLNRNLKIKP